MTSRLHIIHEHETKLNILFTSLSVIPVPFDEVTNRLIKLFGVQEYAKFRSDNEIKRCLKELVKDGRAIYINGKYASKNIRLFNRSASDTAKVNNIYCPIPIVR